MRRFETYTISDNIIPLLVQDIEESNITAYCEPTENTTYQVDCDIKDLGHSYYSFSTKEMAQDFYDFIISKM